MRDLLRMSEEELAELSARQGVRVLTSVVLATASGGLALAGMITRFSPGDKAPLPGMDQLAGQLGWAALLIVMLIGAAWVARGVIMKRLQWAIAISLLVHLLLCVTIHSLSLGNAPLLVQAGESSDKREELTLPDYGGMESPDAAEPAWEKPNETATPEAELSVERQKTEVADPSQPKAIDVQRQQEVAKLDTPERREQVALQKEAQAEIERQQREQPMTTPQAVAQPDVKTAKAAQSELEAKVEQAKRDNEAPTAKREQTDVASKDPRVEAAKMKAKRSDPKPQATDQQAQFKERSAAEAKAAATATESVQVSTTQAKQASAQERAVEAARQQTANAPAAQRAMSDSPTPSRSANVSSVRPDRATGAGTPSNATPTAGGAAQLARSASGGQPGQAAGASAQAVAVGSAGGVSAPRVSESAASNAATRGTAATVPLGTAAQGTGAALSSPQSGAPIRGTGNIARQSTGTGQPALGQSEGAKLAAGGSGVGKQAGAVGTQAGEVAVASAAGNASNQGGPLANGPAKTSVGRQSTGVAPGGSSGPSGSPSTAPLGSGTGQATVAKSTGSGLAARPTEPNARLDANAGFANGSSSGLSTSRSAVAAKLPSGATDAEQTGSLVFAGPQAQPSGAGSLNGPKMSSALQRRSAGLPGSDSGPSTTAGPASSGASQPTRLAGGPARPGVGEDRPTLASETQVAGLIKKSVPGIGASAEAKISASLSMRKTESRKEATKTLGGSDDSEQAVERGLAWLAQHQHADGHWSIHEFPCKDHQCTGHGSFHSDTAATGLALLAFLGAGYTHQSGEHQAIVDRAVKWHLQHQKPDGDLFADESEFVWFYSHGMAAIALCEAYGLTKDPALREPAQKALDFIVKGQHPEFGGWRYRPKFESDTSVSGWQLMALKSGEMAGLNVPKEAYAGVARFLDSVESKSSPGQFAYHPSKPASLAMTAEGLLMRQYLGAKRNDPRLIAGAEYLRKHLPNLDERDSYFWYYGTQVMFHMQGEFWDEWNARLRDTLVNSQLKDGGSSGSWNPDRPTPEKWGTAGGRHYVTCLNLLMLEVYYRHLPLYIELGK